MRWEDPKAVPTSNLPQDPRRHEKIEEAIRLRLDGLPYRAIAERIGAHPRTIAEWVTKYIRDYVPTEDLDAVKAKEVDTLDRMDAASLGLIQRMDQVNSRLLAADELARPPYGPEDYLRVFDRIIKIQDRRARLLGLDAAMKIDAKVRVTDALDAEIEALASELLGGGVMLSDPGVQEADLDG